ncbi:MAG: hypothetical protein R3B67_02125 [Phycisphaerales bacterium]
MMHTLRQWISRAIALGVIGPIASQVAGRLMANDGSGDHTLLTGTSMGNGLTALLIVGVLCLLSGVIGGVLGGRREGLLGMGFVLGWVAWTSGRVGNIYRLTPETSTSVSLAIETLVLMLFVLVAAMLISRKDEHDPISSFSVSRLRDSMTNPAMLGAMGVSLVVAGVMSWLFGVQDLPGQSIGVGFLAGIMAGVFGAMTAASMQGKADHRGTPYAPVMLGVMLAGMLMPLVGIVKPGLSSLELLQLKGELPGFLALSPAAWVAGALLGVPVGHSWMEHSQTQTQEQPVTSR